MKDDQCACCGHTGVQQQGKEQQTQSVILPEKSSVLDAALPSELQSALGGFLGDDKVRTLGEWATAVRERTGGGAIAVDELCHSETRTGHFGELDGERYYFECFYDAIILAAMRDRPVDIRTESPDGAIVEAYADGDTVRSVSPSGAVFSFGIDETVVSSQDAKPSHDDVYASICPYVKAFPDQAAYERWAATVPAVVVGMPLAGATELATALVIDRN